MRRFARIAAAICVALTTLPLLANPAFAAFAVPVVPSQAQVWVAGKQIQFAHLAIAYGDPVAPADDAGLQSMLAVVAARLSWQPGTRFVAITRSDGRLVTFTLGSNAVSVDGVPSPMPFAPFLSGTQLYLPLIPLAKALNLGVRGFHAGYVFVPQIVAVEPRYDRQRLIVGVSGSAPLSWHSSFQANSKDRTLTFLFPGFGTDATGAQPLRSAFAHSIQVSESGPPGYPTTAVVISLARTARFAARRTGIGASIEVVIARDETALRRARPTNTPSAVHVAVRPIMTPTPTLTPAPTPARTAPPSPSPQPQAQPVATPSGGESPPEPTEVATAQPLGPGPAPSGSSPPSPAPSGSPSFEEQKITDVSVVETPMGTRVTLTLTGPVAFEWHRLAQPDNRYWLDIDRTLLVGPAQLLLSKLAFVKEIKISQHLLVPDKVVRLSIVPTQAVDVRVGTIEGQPHQLGIEIERQPPAPDAANAGIGSTVIVAAGQSPRPVNTYGPTRADLIVIDPGHGGTDPGSLNPSYGLTEGALTLAISRKLAASLKKQGWNVTLTRDGDYDVGDPNGTDKEELQARCDVANASGARLFISIHINSSVSSAPNGVTTYYWHTQDRDLAQSVQNDMVAVMGIADDGVKRNNFYVIHHTAMPSILVEAAYLSNPHDATLLSQPAFLDKIAEGIARGIGDFTGGPLSPVGQSRQLQRPGSQPQQRKDPPS